MKVLRAAVAAIAFATAASALCSAVTGWLSPNVHWRFNDRIYIGAHDGLLFADVHHGRVFDFDRRRSCSGPGGCSRLRPDAQCQSRSHIDSSAGQFTSAIWAYSLPAWWIVVAAGAVAFFAWPRRKRTAVGTCSACGYDLRGNRSGRCPECGRPLAAETAAVIPRSGDI